MKNKTDLSKYYWQLKDGGKTYIIKWDVITRAIY